MPKKSSRNDGHRRPEILLGSPFQRQPVRQTVHDNAMAFHNRQSVTNPLVATDSHARHLPTDFSTGRPPYIGTTVPTPPASNDNQPVSAFDHSRSPAIVHRLQCLHCGHLMHFRSSIEIVQPVYRVHPEASHNGQWPDVAWADYQHIKTSQTA
jgi:hypothetical protein